ncbi:MAG: T9SS type A sorting domain-containing protein [Bacteroidetes bacterium]|nr:T9SS type A sorting domain-containing protein [Bacteroidota bacterium]
MKNNTTSDVVINAESAFQAPVNDLITNAINLLDQAAMPYVEENIHFLMATNTDDSGQQECSSGNVPGIWYKITPQQDGEIDALLSSANNSESVLIIYESLNPDATTGIQLTWVNQPNNFCGVGNSASVNAVVGKTYYIFAASTNAYADITIDVSQVLSTNDTKFIDFSYYPNPVINELHFKAKTTIENIQIFNMLGQQIFNQKINDTNGSVSLSTLNKGLYLAEIISEGKKSTFKIVKK